jgi:hypothetical protein
LILERARNAYLKLDEIAQSKFFMIPSFHTLEQLHRMIHEIYFDFSIDIRELYETIVGSTGLLKCHYNQPQQYYIVQYGSSSLLNSASSSLLNSPPLLVPPGTTTTSTSSSMNHAL